MKRVAFYANERSFVPILAPISDLLAPHAESLITSDRATIVRFRPHVVVCAGRRDLPFFRRHLPQSRMGLVVHGWLRKGRVRGAMRRDRRHEAQFDFVCVGDETTAQTYSLGGSHPPALYFTGFPQADRLFRRERPPDLPLDRDQPTVLFAPTWNLGFSAAPMLRDRLAELIRGDGPPLNIIIKSHPQIPHRRPNWVRWWQELAARDSRVYLVPDAAEDVTPYMLASDVLVSDASTAIFQFLSLARPIVVVTNPDHRWDPAYDPNDIVWRWRDVGREVTDPARLGGAVAGALSDPGADAEVRERYSRLLFDDLRDGRSAERVADAIMSLLAGMTDSLPPVVQPTTRSSGRWRYSPLHRLVRTGRPFGTHLGAIVESLQIRAARSQLLRWRGKEQFLPPPREK